MREKISFKNCFILFVILTLSLIVSNLCISTDLIPSIIESLMPIILGIILAYIIYLPEKRLEVKFEKSKKPFLNKNSRTVAMLICYFALVLIVFIFINIIGPILKSSASDFISNLPRYYRTVESYELFDNQAGKYIIENLKKVDLSKYLDSSKVTTYVKSTISIVKGIFSIFVSVVLSVYLLAYRNDLVAFWDKQARAHLDKDIYSSIRKYLKKAHEIFSEYFFGQMIDAVIVGVLASIVLLCLGVKYAVLLGIIIGISNLIPFFGAIFGIGLALIIILLTTGFKSVLYAGIMVLIIQQLDANIINPKITSSYVDVSPIVTIVSITLGGALFGIIGMFLAVPVVALIKLIMIDRANDELKEK